MARGLRMELGNLSAWPLARGLDAELRPSRIAAYKCSHIARGEARRQAWRSALTSRETRGIIKLMMAGA